MAKKNIITLSIGDWSKDGHNQSDEVIIETDLTAKQLDAAYKKGVKIVGVDLVKDCCHEFEDNTISVSDAIKMLEAGVFELAGWDGIDAETIESEEGIKDVFSDGWETLYFAFCKIGNPKFKYKKHKDDRQVLRIGGYGLYSL